MKSNQTENLIKLYVSEKKTLFENFPIKEVSELVEIVWKAYLNGSTIYACGNGGNAAYVSNMITDLTMHPFVSDNKDEAFPINIKRLKAINLVGSTAKITAILNDIGPDAIFSQQLINHSVTRGDVVFGFSGSGNSANIIEAFKVAKESLATTVGITRGDGGAIKTMAEHTIIIPGDSRFPGQTGGNNFNFHFEDALSSIAHMVTGIIKERVHKEYFQ